MSDNSRLSPCVSLPLEDKTLKEIVEKAKDWALMHGVGMRDRKNFSKDVLQVAPFVLLPSPFPRKEFNKAIELQPILNLLMHKVAHDEAFLEETLKNALSVDAFTASLYDIWVKVRQEGFAQPVSLGMLRSDLMLETRCPHESDPCTNHKAYCSWKQVEINAIASGFGHLGPVSREIQSYVLRQLGHGELIKNMPENRALSGLCAGIIEAYDLFAAPSAVVVFVVEEVAYNICDQRFHEFEIAEKRPDIQIFRKTLSEINNECTLNDKKQLILDGRPVAVVYYRSGYEPGQYPTACEWDARLLVERSTAIKCPSIQYQLAGTKKVQQALAAAGALERFLPRDQSARVRDIFTGLYALDLDDGGERAVEMALKDAERFVLKPQREGGGNNIYGAEVRAALTRLRACRERAAYILMERIVPPRVAGYVVRAGAPRLEVADLVSELGVFGVILSTKETVHSNRQVGHMLRTKLADADEGGVAAGCGALDSPYLVDM